MVARRQDLALVAGLAALAVVAAVANGHALIRLPLAGLLVLALPGYAIQAACLPTDPGRPERVTLGIGLSLAVAVLGGFLLNLTPWGLRTESWAGLLGGLTISASALAWWRRRAAVPTESVGSSLSHRQRLTFGLAALATAAAVAIAVVGVAGQPRPDFTQLWLLPGGDGQPSAIRVGLASSEDRPMRYTLQVNQAGRELISQPVALKPGERWEGLLILDADERDGPPLEARLFRDDRPDTPYRRVWLQLAGGQRR